LRLDATQFVLQHAASWAFRKPYASTGVNAIRCFPGAWKRGNDLDRMLMERVAQGDQAAFRELHGRYHRRIARFVAAIALCNDLAEEISNETLWIVWRSAARFRGVSKVSTWILGIAHKLSLKMLRQLGRRLPSSTTALREVSEQTHEPWSQTELSEWVAAALARLPAEQRMALELAYHLGHSCEEIAECLNCPINTVKTRMFYGRRRLKLLLPRLAGLR
jgi:RNA polymerase sigma-70 factor, ECF subfamily